MIPLAHLDAPDAGAVLAKPRGRFRTGGSFQPHIQTAVSAARAELARRRAGHWALFFSDVPDDEMLAALAPEGAAFAPFADEPACGLFALRWQPTGAKPAATHRALGTWFDPERPWAVFRWAFHDGSSADPWGVVQLVAAPDADAAARCLDDAAEAAFRRARRAPWILHEGGNREVVDAPAPSAQDEELALDPAVAEQVQRQVAGFFSPAWRAVVERHRIPHRRGVLLYGPPGNGKTSSLRRVLAALPQVM